MKDPGKILPPLIGILLICLVPFTCFAEPEEFLRGKVVDKETGDPLPAYVSVAGAEIGRTAEYDGTFSLAVPPDLDDLKVTVYLIGYKRTTVKAVPGEFLSIELELEPLDSYEVTVSADSVISETKVDNTIAIEKMDVYKLPGTAADPVYASQILPGINAFPDSSALLIRGGAPGETAYYFDGIEIDHPFLAESLHESYFSIFDNQIIEGFNISSSGFHPKFGDALSGVMDISAKGSLFNKEGGAGLSILGLNGYFTYPIKNFGSFAGSLNLGHSALMSRINSRDDSAFRIRNGFGKLNIKLSAAHTLRILSLLDSYRFEHDQGFSINSGNSIAGVSLTSTLNKNLVTKFILSRVDHVSGFDQQNVFNKAIEDSVIQARWDTALDLGAHYLEFGGDLRRKRFGLSLGGREFPADSYEAQGTRAGVYLNDRFRVNGRLYLDLGGRFHFLRINKSQVDFIPRISLAYLLTRKDFLRVSVGRYSHFGDYLSLQEFPLLGPEHAVHFSLSYDRLTKDLDLRATLYHKEYRDLWLISEDESKNNQGYGFARGAEAFLKLKKPKYDLLLVYNFLNSRRRAADVRELARSPYEIDHSLTAICTLKFKQMTMGIRYSFAAGLPYTPLLGRTWDEASRIYQPVWGIPYSERYPNYSRLDLNGSRSFSFQNRLVIFYFGITNVLNNRNILRREYSDDYSLRTDQHSIFGRSIFLGIYLPFF